MSREKSCALIGVTLVLLPFLLGGIALNFEFLRFAGQLHLVKIDPLGHVVGPRPHLNTYDDWVSSRDLQAIDAYAVRYLDSIAGDYPRGYFTWEDEITYPGESFVVQLPSEVLEVYAFQGNDSDTVSIHVGSGIFANDSKRRKVVKLPRARPIPRNLRS